jgi:hypothetical protein
MSFLDREDITKEYEFVLIPKKTKKISVEKGSRFFGDGYPFGVQVIINYKEEYAIEDGMIEIFLYNPKVEWVDGYYVMEKQKGVEAYFVEYFANGKMYTLVSRDNVLTITEEKEFVDTAAVLEAIHEEDFNFHDKLGAMINPDVPLGGYIVKSKVDTYFWLTTRQ